MRALIVHLLGLNIFSFSSQNFNFLWIRLIRFAPLEWYHHTVPDSPFGENAKRSVSAWIVKNLHGTLFFPVLVMRFLDTLTSDQSTTKS